MLPDGTLRRSSPNNFGVIGNGHHIKLSDDPNQASVWDESFEREFQDADANFPRVIHWLQGLEREHRYGSERRNRFFPQSARSEQIGPLIECLVSLAVRSPMNREASVALAEQLRGTLGERERNMLIGANMRHAHRRAVQAFSMPGKIAVIYSPNREFIFGDGFYHNLVSPSAVPTSPQILAPLTPEISVIYTIPMRYSTEPQLSTLVIDADETVMLNDTVQVYARKALFYRSEKPSITDAYRQERHLIYSRPGNPVEQIIHTLPGVPDRDTTWDLLGETITRRDEGK